MSEEPRITWMSRIRCRSACPKPQLPPALRLRTAATTPSSHQCSPCNRRFITAFLLSAIVCLVNSIINYAPADRLVLQDDALCRWRLVLERGFEKHTLVIAFPRAHEIYPEN